MHLEQTVKVVQSPETNFARNLKGAFFKGQDIFNK